MGEDVQRLVERALAGENRAFALLVVQYRPAVRGQILALVRRSDDAEDLVQDVFCKVFEKLPHLREPRQFAPWLARIAANTATSWWRQRQARIRLEADLPTAAPHPHPDEILEREELARRVRTALRHLPARYRRVAEMHYQERCTCRDIARFLNLPLSTVKYRLTRAHALMRRRMAANR